MRTISTSETGSTPDADKKLKARAACKRWADKNRESLRAKRRAYMVGYYSKNKEIIIKKVDEWRKSNPEHASALSATGRSRRRARHRDAEGSHTAQDIIDLRFAQKDKCAICKVKLGGAGHIDHIVALSRGGSNWPKNLQILCEPCNLSKGARDPIEFAQSRGLLL